jgi:3D (Asp-Asp-Asp) domain-containing protein
VIAAAALWTATAYCTGSITKAGTTPVPGWTIAADPAVLPLGSIVLIDGQERMVHDTGRAIKGARIDIFTATCTEARAWGRRPVRVRVLHRGGSSQ